jgi:hypothetical protein
LTKTDSITEVQAGCRFGPEFFMNGAICEMCRPDTYAVGEDLIPRTKTSRNAWALLNKHARFLL